MSINTEDCLGLKGGLLRNNLPNTIHRLKAPTWSDVEGSQKGGGPSTDEYVGRTVLKA